MNTYKVTFYEVESPNRIRTVKIKGKTEAEVKARIRKFEKGELVFISVKDDRSGN